MTALLLTILGSVPLLMLLYIVGIQYERGGVWRVVYPVTLVAFLLDVLLNYTALAVITMDFPQRGEYTFSKRLKRLRTVSGWRGVLANNVAFCLNFFAPDGKHV